MSDTNQAPPRRLTRSSGDRVLAGVCGGLADYTGLDPVLFRVVVAVAAILGGAGIAAYLVAWLVIPKEDGDSHADSILHDRELPRIAVVVLAVLALVVLGSVDVGTFHGHGGGFPLLVLLAVGVWYWTRHDRRPAAPAAPPTTVPDAPVGQEDLPVRPERERSTLGRLTLSAALVVAGVLVAVGASAHVALAILLIVVGAGLLAGAVFGRARGLIALGIVLTVATAVTSVADVPFRGGAGDRRWEPATAGELRATYRLGVGDAELDLRDVQLDGDREVTVTLGMGQLHVWVPDDVEVVIDGHTGFGVFDLFGDEEHGVDVDRRRRTGDGPVTLEIDARVGMGRLEVSR